MIVTVRQLIVCSTLSNHDNTLAAVMSARYPLDQQTCLLNISSFSGGGDTSLAWAQHPLSLARIR